MSNAYEDIIDLPRPVSLRHKKMPLQDRAAQFAPFAALTGYEDAVAETGQITLEAVESGMDIQALRELKNRISLR